MQLRKRLKDVAGSIGEFLFGLVSHWLGFVGGSAVVGAGLGFYERFVHPLPNVYYVGMLFFGFLVAAFLTWRGERDTRERFEKHLEELSRHRPWITVEYSGTWKTDEEDGEAFVLEYLRFRNAGEVLAVNVQVLPTKIRVTNDYVTDFAVEPVPSIAPGDPPVERRIILEGKFAAARRFLHAPKEMPLGIPILVACDDRGGREWMTRHGIVQWKAWDFLTVEAIVDDGELGVKWVDISESELLDG
ncbi:MAG: hypothetical protein QOK37_501 [Thermoanaerobaculia bacterium]|nr:hypothetical protein [Thermoanaerobaculia bacterium]